MLILKQEIYYLDDSGKRKDLILIMEMEKLRSIVI